MTPVYINIELNFSPTPLAQIVLAMSQDEVVSIYSQQ